MNWGSWGYSSAGRSTSPRWTGEASQSTRRTSPDVEEVRQVTTRLREPAESGEFRRSTAHHKRQQRAERIEPMEVTEAKAGVDVVEQSPELEEIHGSSHCTTSEEHHGHLLHKVTIKALVVVAEDTFQKIGTLDIPAPVGVGINPATGDLTRPVRLEPVGEPVLKPIVLKDKLVNEGFIRARLIVEDIDPNPCGDVRKHAPREVVIPLQSVHDLENVRPGDHVQEFAEIEALLVTGTPTQMGPDVGCAVNLHLKAILKVKVVVTQECILSVPAEVLHCLPRPR